MRRLPGYKAPVAKTEVGPDGEPLPVVAGEYVREPVLPALPDLVEKTTQDATAMGRMEQLLEVHEIKNCLARAGCQSNLKTLQRALLMPEDHQH